MDGKRGDTIVITGFNCGGSCKHRFSCMGFIIGTEIKIVEMQPLKGPVVINVRGSDFTLGRGYFNKLEYEIIDEEEPEKETNYDSMYDEKLSKNDIVRIEKRLKELGYLD